MNTIPTTFKRIRIPYTVVGGEKIDKKHRVPESLSLLVLNRSSRVYKAELISQLDKCGVQEVLFIEGPGDAYEIESLSARYPRIRFLLLHETTSPGEQVNIGIEEAHGKHILVIWDDIKISQPMLSSRVLEKIEESSILCTVPLLQNQKRESIPSLQAPAYFKKKLKMVSLQPSVERIDSLFPCDYIGIYNKEKFVLSGGFDYTIEKPHWQKMDFGFRIHMWGERIRCNTSFQLQYILETPDEDTTPDKWYRLFFLKNLSVRFNGDNGSLPRSRFLAYFFKAGLGFFNALREFKKVREWVDINRFRFKQDARSVTELWEVQEK